MGVGDGGEGWGTSRADTSLAASRLPVYVCCACRSQQNPVQSLLRACPELAPAPPLNKWIIQKHAMHALRPPLDISVEKALHNPTQHTLHHTAYRPHHPPKSTLTRCYCGLGGKPIAIKGHIHKAIAQSEGHRDMCRRQRRHNSRDGVASFGFQEKKRGGGEGEDVWFVHLLSPHSVGWGGGFWK